jgi:hypothetical protein
LGFSGSGINLTSLKEYKVYRLTLDVLYAQIGFFCNELVINAEIQLEGTL